jgi:hypothetical protein
LPVCKPKTMAVPIETRVCTGTSEEFRQHSVKLAP